MRRSQALGLGAALAALMIAGVALADSKNPKALHDASKDYSRSGMPHKGHCQTVASANGTQKIEYRSADTTTVIWPYGSQVVITNMGPGKGACAWSMTPNVTFGVGDDLLYLTDTATTGLAGDTSGHGAAWPMVVSEVKSVSLLWGELTRRAGRAHGLCNTGSVKSIDGVTKATCDLDADCTGAASGTTCAAATPLAQLTSSGAVLLCTADTDATKFCAVVEE